MKKYFFILIASAYCALAQARPAQARPAQAQQPAQTVKGRVIDTESQQPVIGANVIITSLNPIMGSATDAEGNFRIEKVPIGRHSIKITSIGYDDAFLQEINVGSGKEVELNIKLTESFKSLDEVVIKAQKENGAPLNDMVSVSGRSFTVDQTKRFAAAVNDPARMALSFAGVATNDDGSNQIIIRGNSPKGLLWRMEGVEIPNPNHFASEGSSGGGISALSANVLSNSDFLTGAFPAEYGNATSGVFDLKLRKGNNEKREYAMQAGVLGLDFAAEGPIGAKGGASYLANYRYSTLSVLNKIGVNIQGDASTDFQDGAFKLYIPYDEKAVVTVWGMGGLSTSAIDDPSEKEVFKSNRGIAGVNYMRYLNSKSYLENIVSYSATLQSNEYFDKEKQTSQSQNFVNQALRISSLYNYKLNARNTMRLGIIVNHLDFNLFDRDNEDGPSKVNVDQKGNTQLFQAYAQWKTRVTPTVTMNVGLHGMLLGLNNEFSIEPRVGLKWSVAPKSTVSLGGGLHSKTESVSTYFAQVNTGDGKTDLLNKNLKLMKSAHMVAGYELRPSASWRILAETYYQHHYHVPIGPPNTTTPYLLFDSQLNEIEGFGSDSLVSGGKGRSYGLELTVEKSLTNGIYFMSTTSLYQSKYTARDGVERDSRFNGKFVQNLVAGKEWKVGKNKTNIFAANIKILGAGGNRVTPVDLEKSRAEGKTVRDWSRSYSEQLPHYFRTDLRVSYTKNKKRTTSTLSLDIQNVSNRLNAFNQSYDVKKDLVKITTQTGLLPILNYRLEF
ncbi:carboxypeptidase-like regulatory domain-containing protein [Dyadobacter sp. CY323]|uniref:TonB-dependent receptor n=1 Tax=Dyadobacter sp. CY323 TaxID=2907302 RepID=UPI001F2AEBE6|nr:carboxypeptidase-like regulatory domain-containing protein [Dyadobacter sp. CY323]MCE6992684.1 carboxypeptidase-like regulatory domain-containing protein [Dyadobacter sp. CY323]